VDHRVDARHRRLHAATVGDRADHAGELRREHVQAHHLVVRLTQYADERLAQMPGAAGDQDPHAAGRVVSVTRARSAVFISSSQNAASIPVSVIAVSSSSLKPRRSAHTWYSPPIVAPKYGGSSEPRVRRTPASRSRGSGCSSNPGNTPSTTLLVGQVLSTISRWASSVTSEASSTARTPWSIRVTGSVSAERTLSGPAHSPAWTVQPRPASAAIA